jgi:hypothetical protein
VRACARRDPRLRLVEAGSAPDDWNGKVWGLDVGERALVSDAQWLLGLVVSPVGPSGRRNTLALPPASTRSRNVAIVFNPSKSRERLRAFMAEVGPEVDRLTVYESTSAEDLVARAIQAVSEGHGAVLAAGGGGTVFAVLNGVHASGAVLGVVPLGTSNDYARSLGIADVARAALALTKGSIRLVDVGRCGFTSTAGTRS